MLFFGKKIMDIWRGIQTHKSRISFSAISCTELPFATHARVLSMTSQCLTCCDVTIIVPIWKLFDITSNDQNMFGFKLSPLLTRYQYFFFCKEFLRFFLFHSFKIAKRVKKKPRLSNFRDTACQLVTEIGKTCGIGLIVSNRECLILFCIIQMTKF